MRGKIPITERIILESEESQWRLLDRRIIKQLKTTGLIELPSKKKIRIKLILTEIIAPENIQRKTNCLIEGNVEKSINLGLARITEFISNFLEEGKWIFIGLIDGENKLPIIIAYYPILKIFIYTQKTKHESLKTFSDFPSLN